MERKSFCVPFRFSKMRFLDKIVNQSSISDTRPIVLLFSGLLLHWLTSIFHKQRGAAQRPTTALLAITVEFP
jgi:hypothetical protein